MLRNPSRSTALRLLASAAVLAVSPVAACSSTSVRAAALPPPVPPCLPSSTATARFTNLGEDSAVAFSQTVNGVVKGIPSGQAAWLVVWPVLDPAYWPQRGALAPDPSGQFNGTVGFGANPGGAAGEEFDLLLVEVCPGAGQRFQQFINAPQRSGFTQLPPDTRVLAQITVKRA